MKCTKNLRAGLAALIASLALGGCGTVHGVFASELASAGLAQGPDTEALVTEADLAPLPQTVQRYFRAMGAVDKPKIWSFEVSFKGRFRPGQDKGWMDCEPWQYNTRIDLARLFYMKLTMFGMPFVGRDTYVKGEGRMLVKMFDLFPVEDSKGPEMNIGELVTYLNDGIFIAPSILLTPQTTWKEVDATSFDVSLTDRGTTVSARVFLNDQGIPTNFSTTDRFLNKVRTEWTTPMDSMLEVDGRKVFGRGKAIWKTKGGDYTYAEFGLRQETLRFNVPPKK
ncbi:MAG: DUF6544 family protein [Bacteroidota bacterium]